MHALNSTTSLTLDPRTYDRALSCVHCGLCLPACPTYTQTGHEADSPRGRIQLMRGLADGVIEANPTVRKHLDLCLDCRGCETACPSGVVYHELIEESRAQLASSAPQNRMDRFMRWIFFNVFVHPTRLKLALLPARIMQKIGVYGLLRKVGLFNILPRQLRKMEQMLPASGALWPKALPERCDTGILPVQTAQHWAKNGDAASFSKTSCVPVFNPSVQHGLDARATKTKVGFFPGCIGSVMFETVNRQAVELLVTAGADVVVPRSAGCCGAIHHHNSAHSDAQEMAKKNIDAFEGVDWIVTNIAGCGAMLHEYDHLLRDDPKYVDRAKAFAARVKDISVLLAEIGLPEMKHRVEATVTFHDACHLAHAQKVTNPPRELLAKVPGLRLVNLPESDVCCGAAGTYNLTQPEMSQQLAGRKLNNITSTGATVCATGNVGCAMQIQSEASAQGQSLQVVHPVEILHRAVFGPT